MALWAINDQFGWFCGVETRPEINKNGTCVDDSRDGTGDGDDLDPWLGHQCAVSAVNTTVHFIFMLSFVATLFTLAFCSNVPTANRTKHLKKCQGHGLRWLLIIVTLMVVSFGIAEGVLTDSTCPLYNSTQPYLYLPSIGALVTTLIAAFYYNTLEKWGTVAMSLLSLLYWCLCLTGQAFQLWGLAQLDLCSVQVVRFDLTVVILCAYSAFVILDVVVLIPMISCRSLSYGPAPTEDSIPDDMHYIHDYVNVPSQITFSWLTRLFRLGRKRNLVHKDLGTLPREHTAQENYRQFNEMFQKEKASALRNNRSVSLFKVFCRVCGIKLLGAGLLKMVSALSKFIVPITIRGIVLYVSGKKYAKEGDTQSKQQHFITISEFFSDGWILLYVLFISKLTTVLCMRMSQYYLTIQAVHVRAAIQAMVYSKSLELSLGGSNSVSAGKLVNFMSTDPTNVQQMFLELYSMAVTTISIIITVVLLYIVLGISALIGAAALLLLLPFMTLAGRGMSKYQKKALILSDDRLKYCTELLRGMKLVKMYGWEDIFCQTIESIRKLELIAILLRNVCFAISTTIASSGPILITLISFGTYSYISGRALTPEVALPSLSLFLLYENSLFYYPLYISYMVTGIISMKRLQKFLMRSGVGSSYSERDHDCHNGVTDDDLEVKFSSENTSSLTRNGGASSSHDTESKRKGDVGGVEERELQIIPTEDHHKDAASFPKSIVVKIEDGIFSWDSESDSVLQDINIEIPSGQLTVVVGSVGSGKSSILSAMLGEMTTVSGRVHLRHSDIAYVAQRPWIINASVRDNITLGCAVDDTRYSEVISACALKPDFEQLPAGDQTEIGEKGINLSGGQKQRISLARALYSNKKIIIMDDPLSALDAHVSQHIVHRGIMGWLRKKNRTIILVTNQLQYLQQADQILVMDNGRVTHQGTMEEIKMADPDLYQSWSDLLVFNQSGPEDNYEYTADQTDSTFEIGRRKSILKGKYFKTKTEGATTPEESGKLIQTEERKIGTVSYKVYLYLLKMTGFSLVTWVIALVIFNICLMGKALKLAEWSEAGLTDANATSHSERYIAGYAVWSGAGILADIVCDWCRTMAVFYATRNLFSGLLDNVSHLSLRFFDTTPIGRILNRFSSDTNDIDQYLFQNLDAVLYNVCKGIFSVLLDVIIAPAYLLAVVPLTVINALMVKLFLASSREVKRLESVSRSPILARFSQTLDGLSTIRAYGYEQEFFHTFLGSINDNCTAFLYLKICNLWLNTRLDIVSAVMILTAGVTALVTSSLTGLSASLVGLSIAVALRTSNLISYAARYYGELEIRMNAVERVEYYTLLPTEKYHGVVPAQDWPASGAIEFSRVSARYDITLEPVLHKISLKISPGEKIGICGRTGSGKSSLTLALLQLIDINEGSIIIDGLDISRVSLTVLRQRLAVIPQDPILFAGTIRKNLDPTGQTTDNELWEALEISQVKGLVSELGGLDFQVSEGGENFSVGQRQLFCLARAFLRKSRILIMDEATASIDLEMDRTLQQVVTEAFKDQTVLTVAHRVATIMKCDTIMVMCDGEIIEKGSPQQLLAIPDGEFASLVQASSQSLR